MEFVDESSVRKWQLMVEEGVLWLVCKIPIRLSKKNLNRWNVWSKTYVGLLYNFFYKSLVGGADVNRLPSSNILTRIYIYINLHFRIMLFIVVLRGSLLFELLECLSSNKLSRKMNVVVVDYEWKYSTFYSLILSINLLNKL